MPFRMARLWAIAASLAASSSAAANDFFEARVRPVLVEHCQSCHGPEKQKADLRLDSRAFVLKGGESGPAIVPGNPEASLLLKAVSHADPDLAMPPKKPRLPDSVIQDLTTWIRDGAPWPNTPVETATTTKEGFNLDSRKERLPWIWRTPERQKLPQVSGTTPATDVDHFIRARLDAARLQPSAPVDPATWLRRVHFTLTGLPPSRDTLHAFMADPSPERRRQVVDQLLASPAFGERWARHWLDLVRYAESRGHEFDYAIANAWQYRDYVVRAFNADLPYDRFVAEHVAGDLLPPRLNPTTGGNESVLATGWAFLGEETHSPVDIRQDECERLDNKVDVLSKTFLGLTVSCARCHDHKFDAITQRDYYALSGFIAAASYRQVRFETMIRHEQVATDLERIRQKHTAKVASEVAIALRPGVQQAASQLLSAFALRSGGHVPNPPPTGWTNQLELAASNPSHPLHTFAKLPASAGPAGPDQFPNLLAAAQPPAVSNTLPTGARIIADFTRPGASPWKTDGPTFGAAPLPAGSVVLNPANTNHPVSVATTTAASRDPFWNRLSLAPGTEPDGGGLGAHHRSGRMIRTPRVPLDSGRIHYLLRGKARIYAAVDAHLMLAGPLHGRLVTTLDAGPTPRWLTHDLTPYAGHRAHFEFGPDGDHPLDVLMVVESVDTPTFQPVPQWKPEGNPTSLAALADAFQRDLLRSLDRLAANQVSKSPELAPLAAWILNHPHLFGTPSPATGDAFTAARHDLDTLASTTPWTSHTAPSLFDGTGTDEHLLIRGKHTRPGSLAPRALPAAFDLPAVQDPNSSGRLELARQLVNPSNPLVARVIVNRVWQHLFGRGLVPTPDNFGYLGERPTHPELLDHLAWQFIHEDHWSLKQLIRRLVQTDTFAMGSAATDIAAAADRDPANLLWHRIPVRRLEGEVIRDSILAVSGRLNPATGGPPIPIHLTPFHDGRGRPEKSGPLDGEGRRSLYGAVRRNFMPAMLVAFDFPTPFSTMGRRNRTNVPGQSLVLRNDPFVHEQAHTWATRFLQSTPGSPDDDRIRLLFESAFARVPATGESESCRESLGELRKLHANGNEVDVWSDFCHALFNANEFIFLP
jgi:mono/diheme cytochrome c family protein